MEINQHNIAQKAGISRITVSRYFNAPGKVSEKTREKIEEVCRELNYMPNAAARSIRIRKFHRIACLQVRKIRESGEGFYPHQLQYINGITSYLLENGYSLELAPIISSITKDGENILFPRIFSEFCVDGFIFLPGPPVTEIVKEQAANLRRPSVWLNSRNSPEGWTEMLFDEYAGGRMIAEYLIAKGRRNIVWFDSVSVGTQHYSKIERRNGFVDALKKAGLSSDKAVLFYSETEDVQVKCLDIFKEYPDVDAVVSNVSFFFKPNEYCLEEIKRGPDFETVYFAMEWLVLSDCKNTAVVTEETKLGRRAAEYLLSEIEGSPKTELLEPLMPRMMIDGVYV